MSTKNGKKSRNRRHEEPSFKSPPIDEPLPKPHLKKNITPIEPEPEIIFDQNSPGGNGGSSRDGSVGNKSRSRSNTPQNVKKMALNNGSDNGKMAAEEEVTLANGEVEYGNGNSSGVVQEIEITDDNLAPPEYGEIHMSPLILDSNEPEPELLNLGGESDSPDLQHQHDLDDPAKSSPSATRCTTRRSQTRYIPTPETPHSVVSMEGTGNTGTLMIGSEEIGLIDGKVLEIDVDVEDMDDTVLKSCTSTSPSQSDELASPPTVTITPATPPSCASQLQSLETSSTHSDTNLSDSTTDNCSIRAVAGSDVTRMNLEQFTLLGDSLEADNDLEEDEEEEEEEEENIYAEVEERRTESATVVDSGIRYDFDGVGGGDGRPRSREGSIARTLTGRKSIRPGTDYRKYLMDRGASGGGIAMGDGNYTSMGQSSGIKRKTTSTEFSTSTPTTLKRRKLDNAPQNSVIHSWFAYLSQPIYNLKNRWTRSNTINTQLPQTNTTPKLTGYKTKMSLERDTVDTSQINEETVDRQINEENDVSLATDAMDFSLLADDKIGINEKADEVREIPVAVEVEGNAGGSNRKSCAIM